MEEETQDELLKSNTMALQAVAELLQKMSDRMDEDDEASEKEHAEMMAQEEEKKKEEEKKSLVDSVAKAFAEKSKVDEDKIIKSVTEAVLTAVKKAAPYQGGQKEEDAKTDKAAKVGKVDEATPPIMGAKDKIKLAEDEAPMKEDEEYEEDEKKDKEEDEEFSEVEKLKKELASIRKSIAKTIDDEVSKRMKKMGWSPLPRADVVKTSIPASTDGKDMLIKSDEKNDDKSVLETLKKRSWSELSSLKAKSEMGGLPPEIAKLIS